MAKSGGGMGVLLLGGGAAALYLLSQQGKAKAADATPAPKPTPKPQPAPQEDDDGGGGGGGGGNGGINPGGMYNRPQPQPEGPPLEERPIEAPVQFKDLAGDERAAAIAAAKRAAELEAKQKARPAPTVTPAGNLQQSEEDEPTPNSHAGTPASGMTTAPIVSMPAARPSTPAGFDRAAAKAMAANVANNIKNKKTAYDRKQLASFQTKAGLTGDGLYGPLSVSALKFYGVKSPPAALFKGAIKEYTPPG
jgi:hypothetical protein